MEFQLETNLNFSLNIFRSTFIHSTHLSTKITLSMVFEHLQNTFEPEDLANGFSQLFPMCYYVFIRRILGSIAKAFGDTKLLALANCNR
jgi:hypothetical protein